MSTINQSFQTSNGEQVSGVALQTALDEVADRAYAHALALFSLDPYAAHVTDSDKIEYLDRAILTSLEIREGMHTHKFWCWQDVNQVLTGECVALLP